MEDIPNNPNPAKSMRFQLLSLNCVNARISGCQQQISSSKSPFQTFPSPTAESIDLVAATSPLLLHARGEVATAAPAPGGGSPRGGSGPWQNKDLTEFVDTEMGNHPSPPNKNDIWRIDFTPQKMGLGMNMNKLWCHVWGNYWYLC